MAIQLVSASLQNQMAALHGTHDFKVLCRFKNGAILEEKMSWRGPLYKEKAIEWCRESIGFGYEVGDDKLFLILGASVVGDEIHIILGSEIP